MLSVFPSPAAVLPLQASVEQVQSRPHAVLGLAMACADRVQSGMNMQALPALVAKMFPD